MGQVIAITPATRLNVFHLEAWASHYATLLDRTQPEWPFQWQRSSLRPPIVTLTGQGLALVLTLLQDCFLDTKAQHDRLTVEIRPSEDHGPEDRVIRRAWRCYAFDQYTLWRDEDELLQVPVDQMRALILDAFLTEIRFRTA